MKDVLIQIGSELGMAALIIGAITFLAKLFFTKSAEAAVLKYGNELHQQLESHKNELEVLKVKYQIQFSSLNEKRGEFIAKLFSELYELEKAIQAYTSIIQNDWPEVGERDYEVERLFTEVKALFEKNRIYLDNTLCESIESNLNDIMEMIRNMAKAKAKARALGNTRIDINFNDGGNPVDIWSKQDEKARKELVENRIKLAEKFRKLIGV